MLNILKNDFIRVHSAIKMWNDKIPTWAIVIYYILMFPIGIMLTPFAMLYAWYIVRKLTK